MTDEPRPATPPTPLLYLDVDDEITSAAARIRSADADHMAIVLPYGSRLATSRINFRLLAREAEERGKRIEIVSADSSARALASAAGLAVHPSVAAFEAHRSGVGGETGPETQAPGGGNGTEAIAPPGVAKAPVGGLSIEDDTRTRVLERPRRRSERVPIVGPPRPPMRTGVAVGLGLALVVLVLVGGMLALELLPSATIVLNPRSEAVGPLALTVEARVDATAPDAETLVIPAQRFTFALEAAQTFPATGVKVTETKATGNVTFSNNDTGNSNRIDAGSIVATKSGVAFQTLANVTLPPAFLFPFFPSTASVGIEAVIPGTTGNVDSETITVIPKGENKLLLQVTNREPTTGGTHAESPQVSETDVAAAREAIDLALATELDRQVAEATGVPAGITLFPQTRVVGESQFDVDPGTVVGAEAADFDLAATAPGTALGVDPSAIPAVAEARLRSRVSTGWSLVADSITSEVGIPSVFGEVIGYPVTIRGMQVHDVDQAALIGEIRGLVLAEARSRLDDFGDVQITLWPDWVTTIPTRDERITFTLADPQPAPSPTPGP